MNCLRVFKISFLVLNSILIFNIFYTLPRYGVECALPFGIFPILPSEWYYKPTPREQVVFGLILVKAMTLRLLSIVGILPIPYHLNDLFTLARSFGKRSVREGALKRNLTLPRSDFVSGTAVDYSIAGLEREGGQHSTKRRDYEDDLSEMLGIFSGIRRMDINNCFLKTLCLMRRNVISRKGTALIENRKILNSIRYLNWIEQVKWKSRRRPVPVIMGAFIHAIRAGEQSTSSCSTEFPKCSLAPEKVLKYDSMIMPMF